MRRDREEAVFETEALLVASAQRQADNPLARARQRREREHEHHMAKIKREMEQQREVLDQILHPAGIEERMKEFRARERSLRMEREERIRARYEKTKISRAAKAVAEAHPPQPPKAIARPLGALPPILDVQDHAMRDLRRAKAKEQLLDVKKVKQHALVNSATKSLVNKILECGVDRKGFVRLEATLVQQFARVAVSRRVIQRQQLRCMSPTVLSLLPRQQPCSAQQTHYYTVQADSMMDFIREVVNESIDNAKIVLTKEYVTHDVHLQ